MKSAFLFFMLSYAYQKRAMYTPYIKPVVKASPDVKVPEPRLSKFILFLLSFLARPYLATFFGSAGIVLRGEAALFDAFKKALAGESRCIIAFRHPNGGEPQLLAWYFLYKLKAAAAKKGVRFARNPHALFIYGYEVVRWGGLPARLIMPNVGAMPIHHSKIDSKGMSRIYKALAEGPYPLALAPEGQVSYTTDSVPRLEPGAIRIGFNAAQQLFQKEAASRIPVEILPISIHFRYAPRKKRSAESLLRKTEKFCGFSRREALPFQQRLQRCRDFILSMNEKRYGIESGPSLPFDERLDRVNDAAINTAERMLGIKGEGDFFARLYKIRHHCWDRIFLPDVDSFDRITYLERNMLNLNAGEAWHIARHQELADFCWYFRHPVPSEETALHNKIEYVQNLWDFANRTMGGAISGRVNIFPRNVIIQTAPAISISECLPLYKEDKKAAVTAIMSDMEKAFIHCISEANSAL